MRAQVDLGLQAQPGAHRLFDAFVVDHRQHAGKAGIDERLTWLLGSAPNSVEAPENSLDLDRDLGMDFHADHDFPVAGFALDSLDLGRGAFMLPTIWPGECLKSAAVSIARAARSRVASSNALPISCRPSGRPLAVRPAGTADAGQPGQVHRHGEDVLQIHRHRIGWSWRPRRRPGRAWPGSAARRISRRPASKSRLIRVRSFWARE